MSTTPINTELDGESQECPSFPPATTAATAKTLLKETRERWRDIYKYEGLFQVSNKGNVKNLRNGKLLAQTPNKKGYLSVNLYKNFEGVQSSVRRFVHQLVALAFVPVYSFDRNRVNHLDGDKTNNASYNLEWTTNKENSQHYVESLRKNYKFADENINTKLKVYQVQKIRQLYDSTKMTQKELAEMYEVSQSAISQIVNAKIRKRERLLQKQSLNEEE